MQPYETFQTVHISVHSPGAYIGHELLNGIFNLTPIPFSRQQKSEKDRGKKELSRKLFVHPVYMIWRTTEQSELDF